MQQLSKELARVLSNIDLSLSFSNFRRVVWFVDTYHRGYDWNSTNIEKNLCTFVTRIVTFVSNGKEIEKYVLVTSIRLGC